MKAKAAATRKRQMSDAQAVRYYREYRKLQERLTTAFDRLAAATLVTEQAARMEYDATLQQMRDFTAR